MKEAATRFLAVESLPPRSPQMTRGTARIRSDLDLVAAALAGDADAIRDFVERMKCVPRILAVRNRRSGSAFDAEELEDVCQETLAAVWRKLPRYDGTAALETWVYRFCEFEFLHRLRKKGRGRLVLEETLEGTPFEPFAAEEASPLDHEALARGMEGLEQQLSAVIQLKHYEDLTFEQIGERLALSVNTAKTRYYRGLRKLRAVLVKTRSGPPSPRRA